MGFALPTYGLYSMRRYKIARSVGKKMRIARRLAGMTQEEVAYKAVIHISTLGRIERGESNPPIQTVNKIAQVLRIKPKDLF